MANYRNAAEILFGLEFNSPSNFLHKNKGEDDFTVAGIYKTAHPLWVGWQVVRLAILSNDGDIKKASIELYGNNIIRGLIFDFYENAFWKKMRLHQITDDKIAQEIFVFGVNAGTRNAIRKAQKIVGVITDGLVGPMTIAALNAYDSNLFDMQFDEIEKQFYDDLIAKRPSFARYRNGWHNRSDAV